MISTDNAGKERKNNNNSNQEATMILILEYESMFLFGMFGAAVVHSVLNSLVPVYNSPQILSPFL